MSILLTPVIEKAFNTLSPHEQQRMRANTRSAILMGLSLLCMTPVLLLIPLPIPDEYLDYAWVLPLLATAALPLPLAVMLVIGLLGLRPAFRHGSRQVRLLAVCAVVLTAGVFAAWTTAFVFCWL